MLRPLARLVCGLLLFALLAFQSSHAGAHKETYATVCAGQDDVLESTVFYQRFLGSRVRYENTSFYHAVDAVLATQAERLCADSLPKGKEVADDYPKLNSILEVQFDTCRAACFRLAPQFSLLRANEMAEECASVCQQSWEDRRLVASRLANPEGPQHAKRALASE